MKGRGGGKSPSGSSDDRRVGQMRTGDNGPWKDGGAEDGREGGRI